MAGAAEFSLIHLLHDPPLIGRSGWDDRVVTVCAEIALIQMRLVGKLDVAGVLGKLVADRLGGARVAFGAVGTYAESGAVIVTAAA